MAYCMLLLVVAGGSSNTSEDRETLSIPSVAGKGQERALAASKFHRGFPIQSGRQLRAVLLQKPCPSCLSLHSLTSSRLRNQSTSQILVRSVISANFFIVDLFDSISFRLINSPVRVASARQPFQNHRSVTTVRFSSGLDVQCG